MEWTYNNGTATYKQDTSEGWELNGDGLGVTYTAPVTDTYATIKGLAKITDNTETTDVNEAVKAVTEGITVSGTTLTITDPALLTTSNVTVTAGKGHDAYTLKIGGEIPKKAVNDNIWAYSGTTATFKNVDQAYYDDSTGSIKYIKEGKATVLATVKGIAKGATSGLKTTTVGSGSTVGVIKISKDAVGTTNITLGARI